MCQEAKAISAPRAAKKVRGGYAKGLARREDILSGVIGALADGALHNPSLRAIARHIGLEAEHILYYFKSRDELLHEVIARWDDSLNGRSPRDLSSLTLEDYANKIQNNVQHPGIVTLYLEMAVAAVDQEHPAHEYIAQRFVRTHAILAETVRREQSAGTVRENCDPDVEARILIALGDGLQLQSLVDRRVDAVGPLRAAIAALRPPHYTGGAESKHVKGQLVP